MNCFYCGKRVSLVRKRVDTDFCSDDHRQKYHARTRRTIETLREADEQIAVTRRLNEGMPLPANAPRQSAALDALINRNPGPPAPFGWGDAHLPASRARLDTWMPPALISRPGAGARKSVAALPLVEKVRLIPSAHKQPRTPRALKLSTGLSGAELKLTSAKTISSDCRQLLRTASRVELGDRIRSHSWNR